MLDLLHSKQLRIPSVKRKRKKRKLAPAEGASDNVLMKIKRAKLMGELYDLWMNWIHIRRHNNSQAWQRRFEALRPIL